MQSRANNPLLIAVLIIVIVLAIGLLVWQYMRGQPSGEVPESAYPQPQTNQPTVEQVGPPSDVVPAGTPGSTSTPPPVKGR